MGHNHFDIPPNSLFAIPVILRHITYATDKALLNEPRQKEEPTISLCSEPDESSSHLHHPSLRIDFNIIPSSMPRSPKWPLPMRISNHNFVSDFSFHIRATRCCPSNIPWFNRSNKTGLRVKISNYSNYWSIK